MRDPEGCVCRDICVSGALGYSNSHVFDGSMITNLRYEITNTHLCTTLVEPDEAVSMHTLSKLYAGTHTLIRWRANDKLILFTHGLSANTSMPSRITGLEVLMKYHAHP